MEASSVGLADSKCGAVLGCAVGGDGVMMFRGAPALPLPLSPMLTLRSGVVVLEKELFSVTSGECRFTGRNAAAMTTTTTVKEGRVRN